MFSTEDILEALAADRVIGVFMHVLNQLDDLVFQVSNEDLMYRVFVRLEQDAVTL